MFVTPIYEILWTLIFTWIFCHFGEQVSNSFTEIYEENCNFNWYQFPLNIQRTMLDVIGATQQPIVLRGFGNILCIQRTFKQVNFHMYFDLNAFH